MDQHADTVNLGTAGSDEAGAPAERSAAGAPAQAAPVAQDSADAQDSAEVQGSAEVGDCTEPQDPLEVEDSVEVQAPSEEPEPLVAQGSSFEPRPQEGGQDALEVDVQELIAAAAKKDEYLALAQRTQADFENYRKRALKEAASAQKRGVAKLAQALLPALDNLDRAIEAAQEGDPLLEGVKLVRTELHEALTRVGVESFSPQGERFDPSEHEAVAQRQVDGAESGEVVEVYQAGYRMGEEIIRPARVLVAA